MKNKSWRCDVGNSVWAYRVLFKMVLWCCLRGQDSRRSELLNARRARRIMTTFVWAVVRRQAVARQGKGAWRKQFDSELGCNCRRARMGQVVLSGTARFETTARSTPGRPMNVFDKRAPRAGLSVSQVTSGSLQYGCRKATPSRRRH